MLLTAVLLASVGTGVLSVSASKLRSISASYACKYARFRRLLWKLLPGQL